MRPQPISLLLLTFLGSTPLQAYAQVVPSAPVAASENAYAPSDYKLGAGDKVRLTVYGEPNLTGEFFVSTAGTLSLPLIGEVRASGRTIPELVAAVSMRLSDGYIRDPKVAAEVLTYRPYFILGEISRPGEYPYTSDLTVLNAVATAGGFTYRAQKRVVYIRHPESGKETEVRLTAATPVQPGDTIRIKERYF